MTDIFLRIAERALGLASTIQPMVAPLYAPTSYDEPFELAADKVDRVDRVDWEIDRESSNTADVHSNTDMAIGRTNVKLDAPVSLATNSVDAAIVANQTHLPLLERNATSTSRIEQIEQIEQMTQQAQHFMHLPEQPVLAQAANGTHTNIAQPVTATHENKHRAFPPLTRQEHVRVVQQPPSAPLVASPPAPVAGQQTMPLRAENMPYRQRSTAQSNGQEQKTDARAAQHTDKTAWDIEQTAVATPTVHVTIGRIEVRANSAPTAQAQTQRQHSAPKPMSLNEYLQQNSKGGRS